jgi:hypothetical protein
MPKRTIHDDVQAAIKRLDTVDPGLKRELKKAYGYAVFPAVGKAALVLGGAYGRGEVYERGKVVGYATIAQATLGVQVGGETFTEVLVFDSKEPLDRFKRGKTAFAANAAAVLVKAGAAGTADFENGVAAYAYSDGGMLLEAAIGGQRFHFQPAEGQEMADEESEESESGDQGAEGSSEDSALMGKATEGLKSAASSTGQLLKDHPVAATLIGAGVLVGAGFLAVRAMSGGGTSSQDKSQSADESEDQDQENQAEDQADDQQEQPQQQEEYGDEDQQDEDQQEPPRFRRSHARG